MGTLQGSVGKDYVQDYLNEFTFQGVFIHFHGHGQEWTGSRTSPAARVHSVHKNVSICVHDVHCVHRVPVHKKTRHFPMGLGE